MPQTSLVTTGESGVEKFLSTRHCVSSLESRSPAYAVSGVSDEVVVTYFHDFLDGRAMKSA